MSSRTRKLIGTIVLLAFVVFWALFAMSIAEARLPTMSGWAQSALVVFLGLVWVIPAGLIISWMAKARS
jgi:integral membrane sensor domain MASE1